ncbi:hypothetical protein Vadar_019291 [Vaccinium darrowii]|uniref:Uncharacterized protein n=1 Tax=Vaccinium darrowii TaxID=229202 RepID=A0ACB7XAZ6_9ERIC|nr:hypothetical protein Vadar_019291 [Vaccinium darrowii]
MLVHETKLESVNIVEVQRMWGNSNVSFVDSGSEGAFGEQQEAYISKIVDAQNFGIWNLRFARPLYSWEEIQLANLKELLNGVQIQGSEQDRLIWAWNNEARFTVKSAYEKWEMLKFIEDLGLSSVWKNLAPPKMECFVWLAIQESIASRDVPMVGLLMGMP